MTTDSRAPQPIPVDDPADPRLSDYQLTADPSALRERGLFVAEGRLVVRRLLTDSTHRVRSVLATKAAREALGDALFARPGLRVFEVPLPLVQALTGFNIHRGCLAIGERPPEHDEAALLAVRPARLLVLEGVGNPDNIGGIFRNALAFGAGGVLLDPSCGDPLYRKAIRVSSAATLLVRWGRESTWPAALDAVRAAGYWLVALTPSCDAEDIAVAAATSPAGRPVALLLGAEGAGLSTEALARADVRARIPIEPGIDSLNVAVAAGIALHEFRSRVRRPSPGG